MKLREWREKMGLSQRELAERLGLTHGAVYQLEKGLIHPKAETAQHIVAETNKEVSYEDLYGPKAAA
ncbi:helix-turn-helix domain-containing protein [Natronospira bacteriovora]|uniref:Helix-turn-helix transcriptional regulator n=1 Tax=Natronospira bacteriovora TaxID=3069753 RepID=A0ABU0W5J8_9GAMM|nr:helix-turn-helix transcriptional regulator [Natronospira sp. AB-CW4]MDQ2069292.1 helix-turn-helix transcriptional regulator [Natronospira sp. AB-CW4]